MKKAGHIVKISSVSNEFDTEQKEKYIEYCISQVEKELEGLGLTDEYFLHSEKLEVQSQISELRKKIDDCSEPREVFDRPLNYMTEIDRLIEENNRIKAELQQIEEREEVYYQNKWLN